MGVSEFSGSTPGKLLTHLSKGYIDDQHVTYQTFLWVVEVTSLRSSMPHEKQQAPVKHDKQPLFVLTKNLVMRKLLTAAFLMSVTITCTVH